MLARGRVFSARWELLKLPEVEGEADFGETETVRGAAIGTENPSPQSWILKKGDPSCQPLISVPDSYPVRRFEACLRLLLSRSNGLDDVANLVNSWIHSCQNW
jgi:hypothetical protein